MVARRGGGGRRRPAYHPLELAGGHRVHRGGRLRDRRRVPDRRGRALGAGTRELVRLLPVLALATAGVRADRLARRADTPGAPAGRGVRLEPVGRLARAVGGEARAAHHRPGMMATLAAHVEPRARRTEGPGRHARRLGVKDAIIRRFDRPDETRSFEMGKFDLVKIGDLAVGRASYEPGWKWSTHVGPTAGTKSCLVEHVGLVVSGRCRVVMDDGKAFTLGPGDLFHIAPGHDSWVEGAEPYVSLHFLGADQYAT